MMDIREKFINDFPIIKGAKKEPYIIHKSLILIFYKLYGSFFILCFILPLVRQKYHLQQNM